MSTRRARLRSLPPRALRANAFVLSVAIRRGLAATAELARSYLAWQALPVVPETPLHDSVLAHCSSFSQIFKHTT